MTNEGGSKETKMTNCAECDADISIPKDAMEGEIVTCPDCGASFELVKAQEGFELKPAQTVGEDWGQ
ncbi:MAG: Lysine biosynthesis protein LysW [Nitrosopumilales archaeon]|jgi:alpha-aminoadipate carrier protein LysW|nr:MAG: Lysine biosynthesis protein LysW [Nitrosopumilales archaeon]